MKKIAIITCYFDPDYVRARSIRSAIASLEGVNSIVVKNSHKSVLRYVEILWKLINLRLRQNPDIYLLTFRGQEILPLVLLIAGRKPVIFDEFIVPIAYAKYEKHDRSLEKSIKHGLARISAPLYKRWLKRCELILSDTEAHAELSAKETGLPASKYLAVPVSTDEDTFKPIVRQPSKEIFHVLYYGNMLPLHGVPIVIEAANLLKDNKDIEFVLIGGKDNVARTVTAAQAEGVNITHHLWVPFSDLNIYISKASLCLGGPFGNTPQAQNVITGKTYQFLASAVPVVVGKNKTTGMFKDKENCLLVNQGQARALADAILWAYEHQNKLDKIGHAGRKLYEKYFSNKVVADLLDSKIKNIDS